MARRAKIVVAALWVVALTIVGLLVLKRYHDVSSQDHIGVDLATFLRQAQRVATGHSPYDGGADSYPPTLALVLAPFVHVAPLHIRKAWSVLSIGALMVAVVAFVFQEAGRLRSWQTPILFTFCGFTVLHLWPVLIVLIIGQADPFVFAALALSGLMSSRALPVARGCLLGIGGLLKGWPAGAGLVLLQRGLERRGRAISSFVLTILVAPIVIVGLWGGSGVTNFLKTFLDARAEQVGSRPLISDSVWGMPKLWFSDSGLARPLFVSPPLRYLVTVALLVWVAGLLVIVLRTAGDASMCLWNTTFCVVLLSPVSHETYALYAVPILWVWFTRVLRRLPDTMYPEMAITGLLVVWWAIESKSWPDNGSSAAISSVRYSVPFVANLIACTVSVLGAKVFPTFATRSGAPVSRAFAESTSDAALP
jgi:Glycosyltransferase family 87